MNFPVLDNFNSWSSLLVLIGIAFLFHTYFNRDASNLFSGVLLIGLGIHFYGLENYTNWIDHWAAYPFIIGIAYTIRGLCTKKGIIFGIILTVFSSLLLFSIQIPSVFNFIYQFGDFLEKYWPIIIIILGVYLLKRK